MPRKYYSSEYLALSAKEAQFLVDQKVARAPKYDKSAFPFDSVTLEGERRIVGWICGPEKALDDPCPECVKEAQFLLGILRKMPGAAQAATQAESDPFYEDRLRKLHEVNAEARQLVAAVAQENVAAIKPLPPTKTRGDQAVDAARDKSLQQADDAVATLGLSARLLKKIGTDAEVQKALDEGVKAFEPYCKLRKKGKG